MKVLWFSQYFGFVTYDCYSKEKAKLQGILRIIENTLGLILICIFGFVIFDCSLCDSNPTGYSLQQGSLLLFYIAIICYCLWILLMPFYFSLRHWKTTPPEKIVKPNDGL